MAKMGLKLQKWIPLLEKEGKRVGPLVVKKKEGEYEFHRDVVWLRKEEVVVPCFTSGWRQFRQERLMGDSVVGVCPVVVSLLMTMSMDRAEFGLGLIFCGGLWSCGLIGKGVREFARYGPREFEDCVGVTLDKRDQADLCVKLDLPMTTTKLYYPESQWKALVGEDGEWVREVCVEEGFNVKSMKFS